MLRVPGPVSEPLPCKELHEIWDQLPLAEGLQIGEELVAMQTLLDETRQQAVDLDQPLDVRRIATRLNEFMAERTTRIQGPERTALMKAFMGGETDQEVD